jgi:ubiquinone/menaquinone biosynthesis C-methylase UbiE
VAAAAAARGAIAEGVDFSSAMLGIARIAQPRIEFSQGDAEALPYADGSFDAVVANFGVHHVPQPTAALAEMHRVLAPGGRAAFTVWPRPDTNVPWRLLFEAIQAHGAMNAAGFHDANVRLVERAWRVASVRDILAAFRNGTARTAALIDAQDAAVLPAIEAHMAAQAERYRRGDELHIPIAAIVAAGVRIGNQGSGIRFIADA